MFLVELYPLVAISVATLPILFFPVQVIMGIESRSDVIESQSSGLKKVNKMLYKFVNGFTHPIQSIVECLIRRKIRKPEKQIFFSKCIYIFISFNSFSLGIIIRIMSGFILLTSALIYYKPKDSFSFQNNHSINHYLSLSDQFVQRSKD